MTTYMHPVAYEQLCWAEVERHARQRRRAVTRICLLGWGRRKRRFREDSQREAALEHS